MYDLYIPIFFQQQQKKEKKNKTCTTYICMYIYMGGHMMN